MEGILEQILSELREINKKLKTETAMNKLSKDDNDTTFKIKEAASYLGVSMWFLSTAAKQKKIKHFRVGNRYLFKKSALDEWIKQTQEESVEKEEELGYGKLRKVKE